MTRTTGRAVANVILASAGVAAAYVVLTRPPLRRLLFRAMGIWLGGSVPAYLAAQTREAWAASGDRA
jgi:hypothetical protein